MMQSAENPKYVFNDKNNTVKMSMDVVVIHKDKEKTITPVDKTAPVAVSHVISYDDLVAAINQVIFEEMVATSQAACAKKGCNKSN